MHGKSNNTYRQKSRIKLGGAYFDTPGHIK